MYESSSRAAIGRFASAATADARILAAFLGGSYASGTADGWSDLDLYLVAASDTEAAGLLDPQAFMPTWGNPVLHEVITDFEGLGFPMILFILDDGVKGELAIATSASLLRCHGAPHEVLVDKVGVLDGVKFPLAPPGPPSPPPNEATFWRQARALGTDAARGHLWLAQGRLHVLRRHWERVAKPADIDDCEHAFAPLDAAAIVASARFVDEQFEVSAGRSELSRVVLLHLERARLSVVSGGTR